MPRGIRKNKEEKPSQSPAPLEAKDEVIQFDDGTYYRTVAGRKAKFNNDYITGSIKVELVTDPNNKDYFVIKAIVKPHEDRDREFTAYGQCERIAGDKFASLEKAETTAIGRALSHMSPNLVGASASEDEIAKSTGRTNLQNGVRDVIKEEVKKNEVNVEKLSDLDKGVVAKWMFDIENTATKDALIAMGVKIKEEKLSNSVNEELRKAFNNKLRSLGSEEKKDATA